MRLANFSEALERIMRNTSSLQEALAGVCAFIGSSFGCDCVHIFYYHSNELIHRHWGALKVKSKNEVNLFSIKENSLNFKDAPINTPVFISDLNRIAPRTELVELLQKEGNHSFALIPIVLASELVGWIECYDRRQAHVWRREDQTLLTVLSVRVPIILRERPQILENLEQGNQETSGQEIAAPSPGEVYYEKLSEVQQEYKRLLEYGNFVLLRTNPDFTIIGVQGDTERILGLTASEMLNDADIWTRVLSTKTRLLFAQKIREIKRTSSELNDELKFIHVKTGQERWILFRGVPLFSSSKELTGWEAIALDITEKKQAEDSLVQEKRRLQALYEVAHASQSTAEPEIIALRILRTLRHATHSPVGFVALLNSTTSLFELVAAEGFVEQEVYSLTDSINSAPQTKNLLKLQNGRIEDLNKEKIFKLSTSLNLRSAIVMPLVSEGVVGGVLFLARRSPREYSEEDLSIVQIACNQVAIRIKQAQYHIDERKAADSIGVLYRLSHELSKYLTPREVSEHAVRIISEEMPCRRIWLGVMNEQRTHVAGHAGIGPGIKHQIIQLQLELDLRHEFFDEAIESRKPVIVQPGQKMDCSGLEKIIRKLSPQAFVIVPLVSLGQVVGVLVLEPQNPSIFFGEGRLPLLMNIANEIATVLLGRRFEAKVADTEKMKMAGLLASGVSHNFNNLLQTIMGHASLIQMQSTPSSRIEDSARRIVEASGKGAALVNQLMTVSSRNIFSRKNISVNKLFQESRDFYKSVLGPEVSLEIDLEDGIPSVLADYSQIQQVIANLLLNSKDAIEGRRDGYVKLQTRRVRIASGEVSADLAPGSYIRIDVQDNGRGMNEEVQSRCFEPFFTTKGRDPESGVGLGGSGLGLSSAYSILRQHAGYIGVKSQEGSGTIFSIYLPLLHPAVEKEQILREESVSRKRADVHVFSGDMVVISAVKLSLDAFGLLNHVSSNSDDLKSEITGNEAFHGILIVDLDDSDIQISKIASKRGKVAQDLRCIFVGRDLERWQKFVQKFKHAEFVKKPLGAWSLHTSLSRLLSLREIGPLSKEIEVSKEAAPPKKKRRRRVKRNATSNGERDEEML